MSEESYKMLYLAPLPIDLYNLDGVPKKIVSQAEAYCIAGISVTIVTFLDGHINLIDVANRCVKTLSKAKNKIHVINYVKKVIDSYDIFYIRYPLCDFTFLSLLKKIKQKQKKIIVEIPTFPYDEEGKESIKGRITHLVDKAIRYRLKSYVDRVVTFTGEDEIFGIKTLTTINGFDFDKVAPHTTPCETDKKIELIAVSGMFRVHGYDRLIKGIADYKRNGGERHIVLHLVGNGYYVDYYKQLVEEYGLNQNVIFHGRVVGEELYTLYKGIALGVNSLAIHRQNLKKESTLKTKEYAAMGLPIVSSSYVDAFSHDGNSKYVFQVPADESHIDIEGLISFVDNLYQKHTVKELRDIIRCESYNICDIKTTIAPVLQYIKN